MPKLSRSETAYLLGVSTDTLRRWEEEKKLIPERTEGGHRRYDLTKILKDRATEKLTVLYCRVSTRPQKKDLDRQIAVLETYAEINIGIICLCRHIKLYCPNLFTRSLIP